MPANVSNISTVSATWHGEENLDGNVLDASVRSPRTMFTEANALFEIEKRPMYALGMNGKLTSPHKWQQIFRTDTGAMIPMERPVTDNWKPIQNDKLLSMAERLGDHIEMNTVIVLNHGAKVAFTGKIVGTESSVLEEDEVCRYFVGYLGHDGATSFGGMFTNTRVVCANTLGYAQNAADAAEAAGRIGKQLKVQHTSDGVASLDEVMHNIDMARQEFGSVVEAYKRMNDIDMSFGQYVDWLNSIYKICLLYTSDAADE